MILRNHLFKRQFPILFLHFRCSGNSRSTGSTLRTRASPEGRKDSESVRNGNILATRAFIICILCATRGIHFILEQPRSSVMEYHPAFQSMARLISMYRLSMNMSDYGGPTKNPPSSIPATQLFLAPLGKGPFQSLVAKIVVWGLMLKSTSFSKHALILFC